MLDELNNRNTGIEAENMFEEILSNSDIKYTKINDWYDFDVLGEKVDVKSARISHKCSSRRGNQSYAIGRFHFTDEQRENKIWVAFFIRWDDKYIFVGLAKLDKNTPRYFSIHQLREHDVMNINEFLQVIKYN